MTRTGRDRHNSNFRLTSSSQTTGTSVAAIDVGYSFMTVAVVTVEVGCIFFDAGTFLLLGLFLTVMKVIEAAYLTAL